MQTGHAANQDNHGLELERQRRAKEQAERTRKQHALSDLNVKKGFLFSTNTTMNMKKAVMATKELRIRALEGDIRNIESKIAQETRLKEQKERELEGFRREHAEFQKQVDVLAKDKVRIEADIHKLEMEAR